MEDWTNSKPELLEIPSATYLMVEGKGAPEENSYLEAMDLAFSAVMMLGLDMKKEFPVPETLWKCSTEGFSLDRSSWEWIFLLKLPDFVTDADFDKVVEGIKDKKPTLPVKRLKMKAYEDGLCVQMVHKGPYTEEQRTIDELNAFIGANNLVDQCSTDRYHHEIYLTDPRNTPPEQLGTLIRRPVKKAWL